MPNYYVILWCTLYANNAVMRCYTVMPHLNATLLFNTAMPHYVPHFDAVMWCYIVMPHSDATKWCDTVMSHCDATLWCHTVMPHCDATLWCHTVMPHCDATLFCHIVLPHCDATLWCQTVMPQSSTTKALRCCSVMLLNRHQNYLKYTVTSLTKSFLLLISQASQMSMQPSLLG